MKHLKKGRKFHRETGQRQALMKALLTALITSGKIKTTEAKAKELRPAIEKMVTRAKVNTIASKRYIRAHVYTEGAQKKLFDVLAPRYMTRVGGCTRIMKLGSRQGDRAPIVRLEFV